MTGPDEGVRANPLSDDQVMSFPRQRAVTRGFRLGAPRSVRIARRPNGQARVFFIRSRDGRTATGDLWVADQGDGWQERLLVDGASRGADGEVPAAERARRERLREVTAGITTYSLDRTGATAAFAVDGTPYVVNVDEESVRTDTGLPAITKFRSECTFDSPLNISIVEDNKGRIAPEFKRDFFHSGCRLFGKADTSLRRPGKRKGPHCRAFTNGGTNLK